MSDEFIGEALIQYVQGIYRPNGEKLTYNQVADMLPESLGELRSDMLEHFTGRLEMVGKLERGEARFESDAGGRFFYYRTAPDQIWDSRLWLTGPLNLALVTQIERTV